MIGGVGLVGTAKWTGVWLSDILEECKIIEGVKYVEFIGGDITKEQ